MDAERQRLKDEIIRADRGPFIGWWDTLLRVEPGVLRRVHEFLLVAEKGTLVSEKMRHLIWVAVDIVVTHLYPRGAGVHAMVALRNGATPREVIEALEIAASVSCRGFEVGVPIVREAARRAGLAAEAGSEAPPTERQRALKAEIERRTGFWEPWMDQALRAWPDYLEALVGLGYARSGDGGLDPKARELIFFAAHACPAMVHRDGMQRHAERAIALGASEEELLQVLALANSIGLHAIAEGINAVAEHVTRHDPVPG